jgi:hypothetical protein
VVQTEDASTWDAVTEVWFDDIDALRARIAWMADALVTEPVNELFGERHLLAVSEKVLRACAEITWA